MPQKIIWLPEAVGDVARLRDFLQKKNPNAAIRAAERIQTAIKMLQENPEAGKPVEDIFSFRDLFIPFGSGNYVLRYRQEHDKIIIIKVKHSREDEF